MTVEVAAADTPAITISIPAGFVAERPTVQPGLPWSDWESPVIHNLNLRELQVSVQADGSLWLGQGDQPAFARVGETGRKQLSWFAQFPVDFVQRLRRNTAASLINELLVDAKDRELTVLVERGEFKHVFPSCRRILSYAETAQVVMDRIRELDHPTEIREALVRNDSLLARFVLPNTQQPITRSVGDVLSAGVEVRQNYGQTHTVSLYFQRLVCLNGATAMRNDFKWRSRTMVDEPAQVQFLRDGVDHAIAAYGRVVERARLMAETNYEGGWRDALHQRALAMNLPRRHFAELEASFAEEPGDTEWHMLNAFTRLGTHGDLPESTQRALLTASGDWVQEFEIVTARLPRPMAIQVGAHIIEE